MEGLKHQELKYMKAYLENLNKIEIKFSLLEKLEIFMDSLRKLFNK